MSQKDDKKRIYQSKEWKLLRNAKREANPSCERCLEMGKAAGVKKGWIRPVQVIHHKIPIETARNFEEMKAIAFRWDNLQSLCFKCHSEIHEQMKSRSKEGHKRASEAAFERWKARQQRFINNKTEDNGIQKEVHTGLIRETSADRAGEAQAQTDSEGNGDNPHEMG